MSKRDNVALKLDILECKFRNTKARYPKTKVLIKAKNQKALSSIVNTDIAKEEALERIQVLKEELCERKIHAANLKLTRTLKKIAKQESSKYQKLKKEAQRDAIDALDLDVVVRSKLCKLLEKIFLKSRNDSPPEFLPEWAREAISDSGNKYNPKHVFKSNSSAENDVISKLWNHKEVLELLKSSELSLRLVQGPVKRENKVKEIDEAAESSKSDSDDSESDSGSESGSDSDSESDSESASGSESEEIDISAYDGLLAASSDEEEEIALKPDVNYNEITDEEPSDDEQFDITSDEEPEPEPKKEKKKKEKKGKKEKTKLPALMSGYVSGGSDDEDEVVKEVTTTRKNRRGQRERQRIWELKYGARANHVQKERERVKSEREIKQQQFEERQRRREEKAKNNPNFSELKQRKPREEPREKEVQMHPSWVAKQKAKEKELHTKFQGKKVVFD